MRSVFGKALFHALALAGFAFGLSACGPAGSTSATPTGPTPVPVSGVTPMPPPSTTNSLGMNVGAVLDSETNRIFADAIATSRIPWTTPDLTGNVTADQNGWPLRDAALRVWTGTPRMDGVYALSFQGQATVSALSCAACSFSPVTYVAATNTSTATLAISGSAPLDLTLVFTNTRATVGSASNSGVTNVRLMRPKSEDSGSSYAAGTTFTIDFKNSLAPFSVLRFSDWLASNGNTQQHWADRVTPASASQVVLSGVSTLVKGASYEYAFQLCTELQKDCWINVPVEADDDYVRNLALLAQTKLSSNLHLYVEYSNELWNENLGQWNFNHAAAQSNLGVLAFDGTSNSNALDWRRIAQRGAQISTIFRSVFGDAAMMTRIRPVLMTELGSADGPLQQAVHLLQDYYNNPKFVSAPHAPNYYFYGIGGGADYAPSDKSSAGAILASLPPSAWPQSLQKDAAYAVAFGLHRIAYEGGPAFVKTTDFATNANLAAAHDNPGITQAIVAAHNTWSANAGDLLVYYTLTGDYQWGFLDDVYDLTVSPQNSKIQALSQLAGGIRAQLTYGKLLPATLAAAAFDVPSGGLQSELVSGFTQGTWFGYVTRVDAAGTFAIGLHAASADTRGSAEIWVDGSKIGAIAISAPLGPTGDTSATGTLPVVLLTGPHGIILRGAPGTSKLTVTTLDITRTSSATYLRRR